MSESGVKPLLTLVRDAPAHNPAPPAGSAENLGGFRPLVNRMGDRAQEAVGVAAAGLVLARGLPATKDSEALRAWLCDHVDDIRNRTPLYGRMDDLRQVVIAIAERVKDRRLFECAERCLSYGVQDRTGSLFGILLGIDALAGTVPPVGVGTFVAGVVAGAVLALA